MLDVYTTTGSVDEEVFLGFLEKSVPPHLLPFNGVNPHSVLLMDNASIHRPDSYLTYSKYWGSYAFYPPILPRSKSHRRVFLKGEGLSKRA